MFTDNETLFTETILKFLKLKFSIFQTGLVLTDSTLPPTLLSSNDCCPLVKPMLHLQIWPEMLRMSVFLLPTGTRAGLNSQIQNKYQLSVYFKISNKNIFLGVLLKYSKSPKWRSKWGIFSHCPNVSILSADLANFIYSACLRRCTTMFVVPVQIVSVRVCLAWQHTSEGMCGRRPRRTLFCELLWTNEGLDFSVGNMRMRVE